MGRTWGMSVPALGSLAALACVVASAPAQAQRTSVPPGFTVATGSASGVRTTVTMYGTVATAGIATTWSFQYGTTRAYGQRTTPARIAAGAAGPADVEALVTGLKPGTTYHYRLEASPAGLWSHFRGRTLGADLTFTTPKRLGRARARKQPGIRHRHD